MNPEITGDESDEAISQDYESDFEDSYERDDYTGYEENYEYHEELQYGIYGDPESELEDEMDGEMRAIESCRKRGFFARLFKKCVCGYHA